MPQAAGGKPLLALMKVLEIKGQEDGAMELCQKHQTFSQLLK